MAKTQTRPKKKQAEARGSNGSSTTSTAHSDEQLEAETQSRYEKAKKSELSICDLQKMSIDQLHESWPRRRALKTTRASNGNISIFRF